MGVALPTLDVTAFSDRTTRYKQSITPVPSEPATSGLFVLKDAGNNAKIGKRLEKGRWRGMRIFSLTLIERATCWVGCQAASICYGDNMPWASRYAPGADLETALAADVATLASKRSTRNGFVVRLHVLGDFYSPEYVRHWSDLLTAVPALHVYGYTHWRQSSPIGAAVTALVRQHPDRASILRSDADEPDEELPRAMTIDRGADAYPGTVICPEQSGQTESCGTCGLCMGGRVSVSFIDHSRVRVPKPHPQLIKP